MSADRTTLPQARRWWSQLVRASTVVVVIVAVVGVAAFVSLSLGSNPEIGFGPSHGAVGVGITSDCDGLMYADAADTSEGALRDLASNPVEFSYGQLRFVEIVTHVGYEPQRYFLAYGSGSGSDPVVREFDLDEVRTGAIRLRFAGDCKSLR